MRNFKGKNNPNYGHAQKPNASRNYNPWNKGKKLHYKVWHAGKSAFVNDNNPQWKGDSVGIKGLHCWIRRHFIKKGKCDFCDKSPNFGTDWALMKGRKYSRKRFDYIELCRSCHTKYDGKGFKNGNNFGKRNKGIIICKRHKASNMERFS